MIPTRGQIQEKVFEFYNQENPEVTFEDFMIAWLDEIDCPQEKVIASQTVNPRVEILGDLESYAKQSS